MRIFKKTFLAMSCLAFLLLASMAFKPIDAKEQNKINLAKTKAVPSGLIRIQNRWKPTQYLNNEKGYITCGGIQNAWWSAMWTLERIQGTNFYRIKNRWKSNQYLHIEHGKLESNTIHAGAWSAMWTIEQVSGTNFYRIRNRWKSNQYIHIEHGKLESSPIHAGAWSAMWTLGSINTTAKTNTNTNRTNTNKIVQYKMTFKNHGAFIAKFKVTYYVNGQKKVIDSGEKAVNWVKTYYIPSNASNVKVVIKYHTGFNWSEVYNGVIGKMNGNRCFKAYGTALGARWSGC